MNGKDLLRAMQEIDSGYITEAAEAEPQKRHAPFWIWLPAAAACLVLIGAVGLVLRPGTNPQGGPISSLSTTATEPAESASPTQSLDATVPDEGIIYVEMDDILINENCAILEPDYAFNWSELFPLMWDAEDVDAYFGWNLQPTYIPAGLFRIDANGNVDESGQVQVYADDEGNVGENLDGPIGIDTVSVTYDQTCMSIGTADLAHRHGFTLTASRQGLFWEDFSVFTDESMTKLLPEEDIPATNIGGAQVIFGHIHYGYGPNDPDTHAPTGYYDIYMAKFSIGGVQYRIIAHDLPLRDVVMLTTDVIWQKTEGYRSYSISG